MEYPCACGLSLSCRRELLVSNWDEPHESLGIARGSPSAVSALALDGRDGLFNRDKSYSGRRRLRLCTTLSYRPLGRHHAPRVDGRRAFRTRWGSGAPNKTAVVSCGHRLRCYLTDVNRWSAWLGQRLGGQRRDLAEPSLPSRSFFSVVCGVGRVPGSVDGRLAENSWLDSMEAAASRDCRSGRRGRWMRRSTHSSPAQDLPHRRARLA